MKQGSQLQAALLFVPSAPAPHRRSPLAAHHLASPVRSDESLGELLFIAKMQGLFKFK